MLEPIKTTPEAKRPAQSEMMSASMTLKPVFGSVVLAPKTSGVSVGSTEGAGVADGVGV
jgi:hypothetical protein